MPCAQPLAEVAHFKVPDVRRAHLRAKKVPEEHNASQPLVLLGDEWVSGMVEVPQPLKPPELAVRYLHRNSVLSLYLPLTVLSSDSFALI